MAGVRVERALISVSDKTGLESFGRRLADAGVEIVASGGTARALESAGIPVVRVSTVTGAPEMLGGRVKTLHPRIHGGILADPGVPAHLKDLEAHDIDRFQLVVVNLYPFRETVAAGAERANVIEQIDIGGPTMIRSAAKNHGAVGVVVDPDQYDEVAATVEAGGLDDALRLGLARRAFYETGAYDAAVLAYLEDGDLPERMVIPLRRHATLRYGENPHQEAVSYAGEGPSWWSGARMLQGKEISFNNLVDAEAAWRLVQDLPSPAVVIVKHTNACGAAVGDDLPGAFGAAWECDPIAAFGGIVATNVPLDAATAAAISERFVEVVIAPEIEAGAAAALEERTALRVLAAGAPAAGDLDLRGVENGFLAQRRDAVGDMGDWRHVAGPAPDDRVRADLRLAWSVAAHTKSNAIVIATGGAAVGVGAGDQSRVGAAERAVARAGERASGAAAASDAFFPFRDGLDTLADAGVTAVVEPGGSNRDDEVIAAAEERGVTLVFTGRRHFRH